MAVKDKPQASFDDNVVDNAELEKLLDDREDLKSAMQEYNRVNKQVKEMLKSIETPTPYRVGRFVIDRSMTEPRDVEFHAEGGVRFSIKLAGE